MGRREEKGDFLAGRVALTNNDDDDDI